MLATMIFKIFKKEIIILSEGRIKISIVLISILHKIPKIKIIMVIL
jgi:hypothetical protein